MRCDFKYIGYLCVLFAIIFCSCLPCDSIANVCPKTRQHKKNHSEIHDLSLHFYRLATYYFHLPARQPSYKKCHHSGKSYGWLLCDIHISLGIHWNVSSNCISFMIFNEDYHYTHNTQMNERKKKRLFVTRQELHWKSNSESKWSNNKKFTRKKQRVVFAGSKNIRHNWM